MRWIIDTGEGCLMDGVEAGESRNHILTVQTQQLQVTVDNGPGGWDGHW